MELAAHGPWLEADAPHSDVVLSCRVRLARNVAGFPFINRTTDVQRRELLNISRKILLGPDIAEGMIWVDLNKATDLDRQLLVERHLISKNLAECKTQCAVVVSGDESLSIMVNEEDHFRMQALAPGLQLEQVFERINAVDDAVEERLDYAFSPRWGYLTACPTNVGTGIRFSVMMHLPALKITHEIDRVRRAAKSLNLAVRGYYGEGSESAGDFYQISNQLTLGHSEEELLEQFQGDVLPRIIEYEYQARRILVNRNAMLLDDRAHRALGILTSARLLGAEEVMKLLSRLRLGVYLNRIDGLEPATINRLFLQIQPAHLQLSMGKTLTGDALLAARATFVRKALCETGNPPPSRS